jgi:hypothetical protein
MLPLWGATIARPTRDIDLLGRGNPTADQLAAVVADCIAAEVPPDALAFDASSIETSAIREQERYGGIRATFRATLERACIKMQVDVGLGDVVTPKPVAITYLPCSNFRHQSSSDTPSRPRSPRSSRRSLISAWPTHE